MSFVLFSAGQLVGLVLWYVYVATWVRWQGGLGFLIGVFTLPGVVVFPVIFWVVENSFPVNYLLLLGASIGLMLLSGIVSTND